MKQVCDPTFVIIIDLPKTLDNSIMKITIYNVKNH